MNKPTTVEPGQMWRDTDQRTKGSGEFTIWAVVQADGTADRLDQIPAAWPRAERIVQRIIAESGNWHWHRQQLAIVYRREADRLTTIRADRLLHGPYEYLGRAR